MNNVPITFNVKSLATALNMIILPITININMSPLQSVKKDHAPLHEQQISNKTLTEWNQDEIRPTAINMSKNIHYSSDKLWCLSVTINQTTLPTALNITDLQMNSI